MLTNIQRCIRTTIIKIQNAVVTPKSILQSLSPGLPNTQVSTTCFPSIVLSFCECLLNRITHYAASYVCPFSLNLMLLRLIQLFHGPVTHSFFILNLFPRKFLR